MASGGDCPAWAKATFDYDNGVAGDLLFKQGCVIRIVEKVSSEWLKGVLGDEEGIFPITFIEPTGAPSKGVAVAQTAQEAQDAAELTFNVGDELELMARPEPAYYTAKCNGKVGKAYAGNLRVTTSLPAIAIAAFDFDAQESGDLGFRANDRITLIDQLNSEWYRGAIGLKQGIFPAEFVSVEVPLSQAMPQSNVPPPPKPNPKQATVRKPRARNGSERSGVSAHTPATQEPTAPQQPNPQSQDEPYALALFDFPGGHPGDLSFHEGDKIILTHRVDAEWLEGYVSTSSPGASGIFPSNFVDVVVDINSTPKKTAPPPATATPIPASTTVQSKPAPRKPSPAKQASAPPKPAPVKSTPPKPAPSKSAPVKQPPAPSTAATTRAKPPPPRSTSGSVSGTPAPPIPRLPSKPMPSKPPPSVSTTTSSSAQASTPQTQPQPHSEPAAPVPKPKPKPKKRASVPTIQVDTAASTPSTVTPAPKPKPKPRPPSVAMRSRTASTASTASFADATPVPKPKPKPASTRNTTTHMAAPPVPRSRVASVSRPPPPSKPTPRKPPPSRAPSQAERALSLEELEAEYDTAVEREDALQTLLLTMETNPDQFSDEQINSTEEQLEKATRETCRLQDMLERMLESQDDGDGLDMSVELDADSQREADEAKEKINMLNAKIKELEMELSKAKKEADAALKLFKLTQLNHSQTEELETEVERAQDLVNAKEMFLHNLISQRDTLLIELPSYLLDDDLEHEIERVNLEEDEKAAKAQLQEKRAVGRAHVVAEISDTEVEYCQSITLCKKGYLDAPNGFKHRSGVNPQKLFANLPEVVDVSTRLRDRLLEETALPPEQQQIGLLFCEFADELKATYVPYCCNFDEATQLLVLYAKDPAKKQILKDCQQNIAEQTSTWDLSSFLIKPVQRIMKYALLLKSLKDKTEADHPDYNMITVAIQRTSDVAHAINEHKREKELVSKYKNEPTKNAGISWHATRKKTTRLNQKLFHSLGKTKREREVFAEFHKQEERLKQLYQTSKKVEAEARDYVTSIVAMYDELAQVAHALANVYSSDPALLPDHIHQFSESIHQMKAVTHKFQSAVKTRVTDPITRLRTMIKQPMHLIEKRQDKKLDVDSVRRKYEKCKDSAKQRQMKPDVDAADKDFRALDTALTQQLPQFCDLGERIVSQCVVGLLNMEYRFGVESLEKLSTIPLPSQFAHMSSRLVVDEQVLVMEKYMGLSVCPEAIIRSEFKISSDVTLQQCMLRVQERKDQFSRVVKALSRPSTATSADSVSLRGETSSASTSRSRPVSTISTASRVAPPPPGGASRKQRESRTHKRQSTHASPMAIAEYDFEADEESHLTVYKGQTVQVLVQQDIDGNSEWWLCRSDNGAEGYVAGSFLRILDPSELDESIEGQAISEEAEAEEFESPEQELVHESEFDDVEYAMADAPASECVGTCTVLYDVVPDRPEELACCVNDVLQILTLPHAECPDWIEVMRESTGETGFVPVNFVDIDS
eukprot:m.359979 g.359979  ORF g.359979 m.359979 type:complete len:1500 (+) comp18847_c0_seq1:283-4782(+)